MWAAAYDQGPWMLADVMEPDASLKNADMTFAGVLHTAWAALEKGLPGLTGIRRLTTEPSPNPHEAVFPLLRNVVLWPCIIPDEGIQPAKAAHIQLQVGV